MIGDEWSAPLGSECAPRGCVLATARPVVFIGGESDRA
jgi:hypothetical protein